MGNRAGGVHHLFRISRVSTILFSAAKNDFEIKYLQKIDNNGKMLEIKCREEKSRQRVFLAESSGS